MFDFGKLIFQARAFGYIAFYPASNIAMLVSAVVLLACNKNRSKNYCILDPVAQCCYAMLVVLAASQCTSWTNIHFPLSIAALPIFAASPTGYFPFLLANFFGIFRAYNSSSNGSDIWNHTICAIMHAYLVLTNLDADSQKLLCEVKHTVLCKQAICLVKVQKLRDAVLDDLEPLPSRLRLQTLAKEFKYNVNEHLFLFRAIFRMIWRPLLLLYLIISFLNFAEVGVLILSSRVLHCIDFPSKHAWYDGYIAAIAAFILTTVSSQSEGVMSLTINETNRVINAIKLELFRLPLINNGLRKIRADENYTFAVTELKESLYSLTSIFPDTTRIVARLIPIYIQIGWLAFTPMVVMVVLYIVDWMITWLVGPSYIWRTYNRFSYNGKTDEIYHNIKSIKMFGWERAFADPKVQQHWKNLKDRKQHLWYAPIARIVWFAFDIISMVSNEVSTYLAIYSFVMINPDSAAVISSADIFQLVSLMYGLKDQTFNLLLQLNLLRSLVNSNYKIEEALKGNFVSTLPHYPVDSAKNTTVVDTKAENDPLAFINTGALITVENCKFAWKDNKPVLKDITFNAKADELVAVVGRTGTGKSSLLLSICGEVEMMEGSGAVVGSIAYMEQSPWIMHDTVRANIIFGRSYDKEYYNKVVYACALLDDINIWKNGDQTVIGERGVNISGGQRARLALARAVYSRADIYVLDDPLSAVDAHVKRHILDHVVMDSGLLAGKLRILSVHDKQLLPFFNKILKVDGGHVAVSKQVPKVYKPVIESQPVFDKVSISDGAALDAVFIANQDHITSTITDNGANKPAEYIDKRSAKLQGWSSWDNALYTLQLCGLPVIALIVFTSTFESISAFIIGSYKLDALGASVNSNGISNEDILRYLRFNMFGVILYQFMQKFKEVVNEAINNDYLDSKIKRIFVENVIHAPLSYFDSTTRQEISLAYNEGTSTIAKEIPTFFMSKFTAVLYAVLSLYRIARNLPGLLLFVPLFAWAAFNRTSLFAPLFSSIDAIEDSVAEGKRKTSDTISDGKQLIRIYNVEPFFTKLYMNDENRYIHSRLPYNSVSDFSDTLDKLLEYFLSLLFGVSTLVQMRFLGYQITSGEFVMYSELANKLVKEWSLLTEIPTEIPRFLRKVNRFRKYTTMEKEQLFVEDAIIPPQNWPQLGKIEFRNFSMKYRSDLEYALEDINLTINPGEKVGIVGRTGAGKSSLSRALFRLIDNKTCEGSILIDGNEIHSINIGNLRSQLGTIPQEPTLFSGMFRQVLDPLMEYTIEDMWAAIIKCGMADLVAPQRKRKANKKPAFIEESNGHNDSNNVDTDSIECTSEKELRLKKEIMDWEQKWKNSGWFMRLFYTLFISKPRLASAEIKTIRPHGLDRYVFGCSQFSNGQQQLFGLCRLLMRKRKIIVLDEATADVDLETDQHMQKLIRSELKDCTVLTIAHRLDTIMKSDRIIVMNKGRAIEVGPPSELLKNGGHFAELVKADDFGS